MYIPYATSSHKKTGNIITFSQFEEENLVENERNLAEDESISSSIDVSSTYDDSYGGSISMNSLKDVWDGNYVHTYINARYFRLKIFNHNWQPKIELTGE